MQIAKSFCPETVAKMKASAEIVLGTWVVTVVPVIIISFENMVKTAEPFDWKTPVAMTVSLIGSWLVNTAKQWLKGVELKQGGTSNA